MVLHLFYALKKIFHLLKKKKGANIAPDGWGSILFLRGRPSLFFTDMLPAVATAFFIVPTCTRPLVRRSAFCYFLAINIHKKSA